MIIDNTFYSNQKIVSLLNEGNNISYRYCQINFKSKNFFLIYGEKGKGKSSLLQIVYQNKKYLKLPGKISFFENSIDILSFSSLNVISCIELVINNKKYNKSYDNIMEEASLLSTSILDWSTIPFYMPQNPKALKNILISIFNMIGWEKDVLSYQYSILSHGQKRIVQLISTLFSDSNVILLDEIMNGIDYELLKAFLPLYLNWMQEINKKVLIVTHKLELCLFFSDKYTDYVMFDERDIITFDRKNLFLEHYKKAVCKYDAEINDIIIKVIDSIL